MNFDTVNHPLWPEPEQQEPACSCGCNRTVHELPCIIDGQVFSDFCASDLVYLRLEGYIGGVSEKTNQLKLAQI